MTIEQVTLAGGCFWCTEAVFKDVIGVQSVESGYIGGTVENPNYKQVCGGDTGHAEAIRVAFDNEQINLADILDIFFATHDPTQLNRQGNDVGTQYRSAMFPADEGQEREMRAAIERAQGDSAKPIVTTIEAPTDAIGATWYPAEGYHQDYWETSGRSNPYCMAVIPPKLQKLRKSFAARSRGQSQAVA